MAGGTVRFDDTRISLPPNVPACSMLLRHGDAGRLPLEGALADGCARLPQVLGRLGTLEVRLARSMDDVRRAQRLRYQVFFEQRGNAATAPGKLFRRDMDRYDEYCDHLLVVDHAPPRQALWDNGPSVVGTYRLLGQQRAERGIGYYSAQEFDLRGLLEHHASGSALELGRSCVAPAYRNRRTMELLWRGIWAYVRHHGVKMMFGCASLEGADPAVLSLQLSFLHHFARAPAEWRLSARPFCHVPMNRMPPDAIDTRRAIASLPALVKAYLRIGGRFGGGAALDRSFGTTDVMVVVRVEDIDPRYIAHYGGGEPAMAAIPSR